MVILSLAHLLLLRGENVVSLLKEMKLTLKTQITVTLIMGLMHSNPELSPLLLLRGENAVSLLKEMQWTHKTQTTTPGKFLFNLNQPSQLKHEYRYTHTYPSQIKTSDISVDNRSHKKSKRTKTQEMI